MIILIACLTVTGIKHHRNRKRSNHHKKHPRQSLASLVKEVQSNEGLDKNDVVDEKAGLFKFTVCCYGYDCAGILYSCSALPPLRNSTSSSALSELHFRNNKLYEHSVQ